MTTVAFCLCLALLLHLRPMLLGAASSVGLPNTDDLSDDDDELPPPDVPGAVNDNLSTDNGVVGVDRGTNCPEVVEQNPGLCSRDLYRTTMQRYCQGTCGIETCLNQRPDLCIGWGPRFCNSTFYSVATKLALCKRSCSLCQLLDNRLETSTDEALFDPNSSGSRSNLDSDIGSSGSDVDSDVGASERSRNDNDEILDDDDRSAAPPPDDT